MNAVIHSQSPTGQIKVGTGPISDIEAQYRLIATARRMRAEVLRQILNSTWSRICRCMRLPSPCLPRLAG